MWVMSTNTPASSIGSWKCSHTIRIFEQPNSQPYSQQSHTVLRLEVAGSRLWNELIHQAGEVPREFVILNEQRSFSEYRPISKMVQRGLAQNNRRGLNVAHVVVDQHDVAELLAKVVQVGCQVAGSDLTAESKALW